MLTLKKIIYNKIQFLPFIQIYNMKICLEMMTKLTQLHI